MIDVRHALRFIAPILLVAAWPNLQAIGQSSQGGAQSSQGQGAEKLPNVIDMSTIKCSDLLAMSNDQAIITLVWMKGFYSGADNDTTWDREASLANARTLLSNCKTHGSLGVMTEIERGGTGSGSSTGQ
jgi:hypothetical protein